MPDLRPDHGVQHWSFWLTGQRCCAELHRCPIGRLRRNKHLHVLQRRDMLWQWLQAILLWHEGIHGDRRCMWFHSQVPLLRQGLLTNRSCLSRERHQYATKCFQELK